MKTVPGAQSLRRLHEHRIATVCEADQSRNSARRASWSDMKMKDGVMEMKTEASAVPAKGALG